MFPYIDENCVIWMPAQPTSATGSHGEIGEPGMRPVRPGDPDYDDLRYDLLSLPNMNEG